MKAGRRTVDDRVSKVRIGEGAPLSGVSMRHRKMEQECGGDQKSEWMRNWVFGRKYGPSHGRKVSEQQHDLEEEQAGGPHARRREQGRMISQ